MYLGKICEVAAPDDLYANPAHPYTRILLASIPEPDPLRPIPADTIAGDLPSPINPPSGCRFRTRCPNVIEICHTVEPEIRQYEPGHFIACHNPQTTPVAVRQNGNATANA
jgi:peptide/nickel transport system ATP-binding protein